jgi:hypothetical protein
VPAGAPAPTVAAVSQPAHGLATIVAGKVRYTPHAGFLGSDSFTYTLASGEKRSTAKLTVQVSALQAEYPPPLRIVSVANANELRSAVAAARPGDHIVLADGTYGGSKLSVAVSGTAANPIVIRAANRVRLDTDGSVRVSGARIQHEIAITGSNIWLYGLNLDGTGWLEQSFFINLNDAAHATIKRCRIYHWEGRGIQLLNASTDVEIAYCDLSPRSFDDQRPIYPSGPASQVRNKFRTGIRGDTSALRADIHHNHFHDYPPKGQKYEDYKVAAIICGESPATGDDPARWDVHHNLFIRCNASAEGVDAPFAEWKAAHCTFRENTFQDCDAHLTFRQGIHNNLIANWFRNVRAVRMMDGPHRLIGNVVESCPTGINILAGNLPETTPQAQKDGFVQAHDVLLAGNRREGSAGAFLRIGPAISGDSDLPALNTRIEGWDSSKGPINYQNHQGTQGPFPATGETWPAAVRIGPAEVGPEAP